MEGQCDCKNCVICEIIDNNECKYCHRSLRACNCYLSKRYNGGED